MSGVRTCTRNDEIGAYTICQNIQSVVIDTTAVCVCVCV
jgi:hypothetical protein